MSSFRMPLLPLAVAALLLVPAALADVEILGQPGSYATLQEAIDAAQDGDVLLIEPGSYAGGFTIDDKSLALLPDTPGTITVNGLSTVRNLAPWRRVSIVGLRINSTRCPQARVLALRRDLWVYHAVAR